MATVQTKQDVPPVRPVPHVRSATETDALVGLKVRLRRMELEMSQEQLANRLGVTAQQVQKYERGTNRIGASRLHQISQILKAPIESFFVGVDTSCHRDDASGAPVNGQEPSGLGSLSHALEDAMTLRLLRIFASVESPKVKSRVVSLVEAVVVAEERAA